MLPLILSLFENKSRAHAGDTVGVYVEAHIHRVIVVDSDKGLTVVISFFDKGDFHSLNEILGVPLHGESVDQVLKIAHGVDMTVEVDVGVAETKVLGACGLERSETALWLYGAGVSGNVCRNVAEFGYVHALSCV